METRHNLRDFALLAGAALLSAGAIAMPLDGQTVTRTEIVKYSAPESTTPEGAKKLYRKLQSAARRVCSYEHQPLGVFPDPSCVSSALSKAVADVASPPIAALHMKTQPASKLADVKKASTAEPATIASR